MSIHNIPFVTMTETSPTDICVTVLLTTWSWRHVIVLLIWLWLITNRSWEVKHSLPLIMITSSALTVLLLHIFPESNCRWRRMTWPPLPVQSNRFPVHTVAPSPQTVHSYITSRPRHTQSLSCTSALLLVESCNERITGCIIILIRFHRQCMKTGLPMQ